MEKPPRPPRGTKMKTTFRHNLEKQFITMVQTGLIIKAFESFDGDRSAPLSRPLSAVEWLNEAYKMAPLIPADVTAGEAAEAFLTWAIEREKLDDRDRFILQVFLNEQESS